MWYHQRILRQLLLLRDCAVCHQDIVYTQTRRFGLRQHRCIFRQGMGYTQQQTFAHSPQCCNFLLDKAYRSRTKRLSWEKIDIFRLHSYLRCPSLLDSLCRFQRHPTRCCIFRLGTDKHTTKNTDCSDMVHPHTWHLDIAYSHQTQGCLLAEYVIRMCRHVKLCNHRQKFS